MLSRVLFVDDDPLILASFKRAFRGRFDLTTCQSGREALDLARNSAPFATVVADMQMPGMNGLDAAKAIRELPGRSKTPIVALTANAFEEDRERCLQVGMNDYIPKPVDPSALFGTLLKWLSDPPSSN